jgi:hypothetical protein
LPHQIDHIIAQQHGGSHEESNLCLCCLRCNLKKGPNIASTTLKTGASIASSPSFILGSSGGRSTFSSEKTVA